MPFQQDLGIPAPGWQGRLMEAAYTDPLGDRTVFLYDSVSREVTKRTAVFEFNGIDGAFIQDNGFGARSYPMRCIFSGDDHDVIATAFEAGLLLPGPGTLEHPAYGKFDVVPTGTITRRNDLVSAANESVIEVTFSTTLPRVYPTGEASPRSEIEALLASFGAVAASEFAGNADFSDPLAATRAKFKVRQLLGALVDAFQGISDGIAVGADVIGQVVDGINDSIDVLIGTPLNLAQQIINLIRSPFRAAIGIARRLTGYARFIRNILGLDRSDSSPLERRISDLFLLSALAGAVRSTIDESYRSKPQALAAADAVASQFDAVVDWREGVIPLLPGGDPGGAYQQAQAAVVSGVGRLIALSFGLLAERVLVTDRARTPVDLCAELYGSLTDERLQFLIDTNRLGGAAILEVPKGTPVVWYG